jgi:hypothetical protein
VNTVSEVGGSNRITFFSSGYGSKYATTGVRSGTCRTDQTVELKTASCSVVVDSGVAIENRSCWSHGLFQHALYLVVLRSLFSERFRVLRSTLHAERKEAPFYENGDRKENNGTPAG